MTLMTIFPALVTIIIGYLLIKFPVSVSVPTDRGMHKNIVSSSGGIALLAGLGVMSYLLKFEEVSLILLVLIGILGFLDDKYSLSKFVRFAAQIAVSIIVVNEFIYPAIIGDTVGLIYILILVFMSTYTINIYNFMDGIDQLAISQAIFFIFSFSMVNGFNDGALSLLFILVAFFLINYPKTKLFLGNCGSYFLGLLIVIIMLTVIRDQGFMSSVPLLILMTTFYVDATYTLIIRFIKKIQIKESTVIKSIKYITEAHRTHLYQKLAFRRNSHLKTVFIIMTYNIIWCLPLYYLSFNYIDYSLFFLFLSYLPYAYYCYRNNAGTEL